jgi:hypothetical protein
MIHDLWTNMHSAGGSSSGSILLHVILSNPDLRLRIASSVLDPFRLEVFLQMSRVPDGRNVSSQLVWLTEAALIMVLPVLTSLQERKEE